MDETIIPIVVVPVIFFSIVAIIKIISDNAVRKHLIEKGLIDENLKYLYRKTDESSSLKWGMILVAVGAAIFVAEFMNFSEEVVFGLMFILAGASLITYYFMAARSKNVNKNPVS